MLSVTAMNDYETVIEGLGSVIRVDWESVPDVLGVIC